MKRTSKILIHAGIPRTATTILQGAVFPRLQTIRYVGKNADNSVVRGRVTPLALVKTACRKVLNGDPAGIATLREVLPAIVKKAKLANRVRGPAARQFCQLFALCLQTIQESLPDKPILYSDESLVESISGLAGNPEFGDAIVLEQLGHEGFLEDVVLSVALRDPAEFLAASYYKTMEYARLNRDPPYSFDTYIVRQLAILERSPSASRIFLCMHRSAAAHYRSLCPTTVVTSYRNLVASAHVVDTLLGMSTGEDPVSLGSFPKENSSWRKSEVNDFILNAAGVAKGITIDDYAQSFPQTLRRYSLDQVFAEECECEARPTASTSITP